MGSHEWLFLLIVLFFSLTLWYSDSAAKAKYWLKMSNITIKGLQQELMEAKEEIRRLKTERVALLSNIGQIDDEKELEYLLDEYTQQEWKDMFDEYSCSPYK